MKFDRYEVKNMFTKNKVMLTALTIIAMTTLLIGCGKDKNDFGKCKGFAMVFISSDRTRFS